MEERSQKIFEVLATKKIDGLLLNTEANVSYAAGFHASDSYALIGRHAIFIITDFRYAADFKRQAKKPVTVIPADDGVFKTLCQLIEKEKMKRVAFESRHLSFAECETLNRLIAKKALFFPIEETIEPIREIKEKKEIKRIKQAVEITLAAFNHIKNKVKPGRRELEIAAEIEHFIRIQGAQTSAFDTIVASGPNSSYPHARISNRILKEGDSVVIDMGVEYAGYKSDLTRTYFLGKIKPIIQKASRIVRAAQDKAIQAIQPGMLIKELDAVARNYIAENGFGKSFGHALGHGVGLEVHESPSINKKNSNTLKQGMIFTIEPGIYEAGQFGIRMEEMVLVTQTGAEVLSGNNSN